MPSFPTAPSGTAWSFQKGGTLSICDDKDCGSHVYTVGPMKIHGRDTLARTIVFEFRLAIPGQVWQDLAFTSTFPIEWHTHRAALEFPTMQPVEIPNLSYVQSFRHIYMPVHDCWPVELSQHNKIASWLFQTPLIYLQTRI